MRAFKLGFVLVLGLIASFGVAQAQLRVSTLGIDFDLAPGTSHAGSFLVENAGDKAQAVSVTARDFNRTPSGENRFFPPGTLERSLSPYLTFSPATFQLEPGQRQAVQFRAELPEGETGPHWLMLLVRGSEPENHVQVELPDQGGVAVNANVTFGVQLRQTDPTRAVADGRVSRIGVSPPQEGHPLTVSLAFENTGTTFLRPLGRVEIRDRTGATVTNLPIDPFRVLPGAARELEVTRGEPLPPGKYVALGIIDFGGDFLVAGQAAFEINVP